ncbi:DUF6236 family protein [Nonomuraea jabiensis]|uniref:DUF6236 family protein n=1 Tax=Nonomuraea jabiensis TaxID=882448 RepID=UPI0034349735
MDNWFGLYYPHVHFRDDRLLKVVALYLDGLFHFTNVSALDSLPRISRTELALADAGFLRPVVPDVGSIERTAERFAAALAEIDLTGYRVTSDNPVSAYDVDRALALWKVSPTLTDLLLEAGTAQRIGRGRLAIDPGLAHAYLLTLGDEFAPELGAFPLADDPFDQATSGLTARRLVSGMSGAPLPLGGQEEQRCLLVNLAITTVVPRDLRACPVHKILKFRTRYSGERARFRQAVTRLIEEATHSDGITDAEVLVAHLRATYDNHLAPALTDLRRALGGLRVDTVLGAVNIQAAAPAAAATGLALLAVQPSARDAAIIGAGGLALGLWRSARQSGAERQKALAASPVSYLYHLQHSLAPLSLAEQARAAVARFAPP